jgi:hypothetical protein
LPLPLLLAALLVSAAAGAFQSSHHWGRGLRLAGFGAAAAPVDFLLLGPPDAGALEEALAAAPPTTAAAAAVVRTASLAVSVVSLLLRRG